LYALLLVVLFCWMLVPESSAADLKCGKVFTFISSGPNCSALLPHPTHVYSLFDDDDDVMTLLMQFLQRLHAQGSNFAHASGSGWVGDDVIVMQDVDWQQ